MRRKCNSLNEIVIKISNIFVKWNKKQAYIRKRKRKNLKNIRLETITNTHHSRIYRSNHPASQSKSNLPKMEWQWRTGRIHHQLAKPKTPHLLLQNEHMYSLSLSVSPRSVPDRILYAQFIHLGLFGFWLLSLVKLDIANIFLPPPIFQTSRINLCNCTTLFAPKTYTHTLNNL